MPKRVLAGYGVDADACANWLNTRDGSMPHATDLSRGIFGATVGIDRVLKLFDRYKIKTTWFVPAHTLESFPEQIAKVRDAGHEIGLHGYTHESVSMLSEQQQREVMERSLKVISDFIGKRPKGWTAPHWSTSMESIKLLEEFGLEYDHSFMHHDSQLYYAPDLSEVYKPTDVSASPSTWMSPMTRLKPSSIVTVPANWHLDDWPPLQLNLKSPSTHGFVDPYVVERLWKDQFDYYYREYDTFVFPISIHPDVSGKPQVALMHERLIEYISSYDGVEWCTMEEMVKEFKEGRLGGWEVKGGA